MISEDNSCLRNSADPDEMPRSVSCIWVFTGCKSTRSRFQVYKGLLYEIEMCLQMKCFVYSLQE